MKLLDLIEALGKNDANPSVNITIIDNNDNPLITYNAGGYGAVESDLGNKKVKKIVVESMSAVTIYIDDAEVDSNDPVDPTDP